MPKVASPPMRARSGRIAGVAVVTAMAMLADGCAREDPAIAAERAQRCAGPPIKSVEQREQLMQDGYVINLGLDCIDRDSYEAMQREQARREGTVSARPLPMPAAVP